MKKISVISPVYNSEDCLEELVKQIKFYLKKLTKNIEIILVNDASTDNSWLKMLKLRKRNKCLKIYNLKKNYGQHYAFRYGALRATGDKIFFLDCDLQHHPKFFFKFIKHYNNESIVVGQPDLRSILKKGIISNLFWFLYSLKKFRNTMITSNFILISRKILKRLCKKKTIRYLFSDLVSLNFNCIFVKIKIMNRYSGSSSYTLGKLCSFAFSLIK